MKIGIGLAFAGAVLLATPVFAQPVPRQALSGAMPNSGIYNAQTANTDYGGMPLSFARPKAKPAGRAVVASAAAPASAPAPAPASSSRP